MPFKHHAKHRHHIPKPRYRVTNGPEYDAALRRRGSLTVWFTDEAIAAWRAEPEPRRVAVRLNQQHIQPAHIIAWSLWRRAHQAAARTSHLKKKMQL